MDSTLSELIDWIPFVQDVRRLAKANAACDKGELKSEQCEAIQGAHLDHMGITAASYLLAEGGPVTLVASQAASEALRAKLADLDVPAEYQVSTMRASIDAAGNYITTVDSSHDPLIATLNALPKETKNPALKGLVEARNALSQAETTAQKLAGSMDPEAIRAARAAEEKAEADFTKHYETMVASIGSPDALLQLAQNDTAVQNTARLAAAKLQEPEKADHIVEAGNIILPPRVMASNRESAARG